MFMSLFPFYYLKILGFFLKMYIAGTVTAVSVAGGIGIGAGIWYLKKVRAKAPVTHGVQSNENRLF